MAQRLRADTENLTRYKPLRPEAPRVAGLAEWSPKGTEKKWASYDEGVNHFSPEVPGLRGLRTWLGLPLPSGS